MRRLLFALLLTSSPAALAADLKFSPYVGQVYAGQAVKVTLLIDNPNSRPATFNAALCPTAEVRRQGTQKVLPRPNVSCAERLNNLTIPAGGRGLYTFSLPAVPAGSYRADIKLDDSVNGHRASFTAFFNVQNVPQVVQWLDVNPVYLAGQPITLKVVTRNVSSTVFSQDLRLCGADFLIRDRLGKAVYEAPKPQACIANISLTTLKPGQAHTEAWWDKIKLPAGQYQVFHWNYFASAVGSFEVK